MSSKYKSKQELFGRHFYWVFLWKAIWTSCHTNIKIQEFKMQGITNLQNYKNLAGIGFSSPRTLMRMSRRERMVLPPSLSKVISHSFVFLRNTADAHLTSRHTAQKNYTGKCCSWNDMLSKATPFIPFL